jgi:predicted cobalt transporter CbtA
VPSWNNIATSDGYQEFRFARVKRVTIAVSNAPILAQFAYINDAGQMRDQSYTYDGSERDMQNGIVWGWDADQDFGALGIVGLMLKSEIPGTPALVTIHA